MTGTVFMLSSSGGNWTFSLLYTLPLNGWDGGPESSLAMDGSGNLYGTTIQGGCVGSCSDRWSDVGQSGSAFELKLESGGWTYISLHDFTGGADGGEAWGGLTLGPHNSIYGTTWTGGAYGYGVIFEITP